MQSYGIIPKQCPSSPNLLFGATTRSWRISLKSLCFVRTSFQDISKGTGQRIGALHKLASGRGFVWMNTIHCLVHLFLVMLTPPYAPCWITQENVPPFPCPTMHEPFQSPIRTLWTESSFIPQSRYGKELALFNVTQGSRIQVVWNHGIQGPAAGATGTHKYLLEQT